MNWLCLNKCRSAFSPVEGKAESVEWTCGSAHWTKRILKDSTQSTSSHIDAPGQTVQETCEQAKRSNYFCINKHHSAVPPMRRKSRITLRMFIGSQDMTKPITIVAIMRFVRRRRANMRRSEEGNIRCKRNGYKSLAKNTLTWFSCRLCTWSWIFRAMPQ